MRHIAPEIFRDSFVGKLTFEGRWLWMGLLIRMADDQGRMADDADEIRVSIFPHDPHITPQILDAWLKAFAKEGKIIRYVVGGNGSGRRLIQIRHWWRYQSSTQWAARSKFGPPPGWIDRIRTHQGQQIVLEKWDLEGGLRSEGGAKERAATKTGPTKGLRRAKTGPSKAQEDIEIEGDIEGDKESSALPPYPPSSQGERKAAGRQDPKTTAAAALASLTPHQRENAETINKIFALASFRDKRKARSLSILVATRIVVGDPISRRVIPAFAAAYADARVKDPTAVAVTRLQNDEHNPAFEDPKTWSSVPPDLLEAAGIGNLTAFKVKRFVEGSGR